MTSYSTQQTNSQHSFICKSTVWCLFLFLRSENISLTPEISSAEHVPFFFFFTMFTAAAAIHSSFTQHLRMLQCRSEACAHSWGEKSKNKLAIIAHDCNTVNILCAANNTLFLKKGLKPIKLGEGGVSLRFLQCTRTPLWMNKMHVQLLMPCHCLCKPTAKSCAKIQFEQHPWWARTEKLCRVVLWAEIRILSTIKLSQWTTLNA